MLLKLHWAQKQMFWAFEKGIFQFKASFWVTKLISFSGKVRQNIKIYLNRILVKKSFLETGFKSWGEKWMFWTLEKRIFQFFAKFWVTKVKLFSEKGRQSEAIYLNQNFVIRTFLENGFGTTLSSKTNVLSVWNKHFLVFCKFLSDEVETIFRESEAKLSKLFKSKFGHRKFVRKWFWSYLELKNEYVLSVWKKHFSVFCKFLSEEVETTF